MSKLLVCLESFKTKCFSNKLLDFEYDKFPVLFYRLDIVVYGLKEAPRAWYDTMENYLVQNGYRRGTIDNTLFIKQSRSHTILAEVYVDDIIFRSNDDDLSKEFIEVMAHKFEMSMMAELTFFLGLQVKQIPNGIFISQSKYVQDMLKKFIFSACKLSNTPMAPSSMIHAEIDVIDVNPTLYHGMIRPMLYLTTCHLGIMFATSICGRYQAHPKESHVKAIKCIFRYQKRSPNLGLWYSRDSPFELVGFTDSNYADCSLD